MSNTNAVTDGLLTRQPQKDKPWHGYRREANWKLLEPGWAGTLDDEELVFILEHLKADDALSAWWGFRPRAKRRPVKAIKRVVQHGDPDNQTHNRRLARMRPGIMISATESAD